MTGHSTPGGDDGRWSDEDRAEDAGTDTFGVGIHVAAEELRFVVHVPSDIDSGWADPEAFQRRIETVTWETLDREATLATVSSSASTGETVTLGTVTMRPGGDVVSHTLSVPDLDD
ncbi:hypothetical protein [Halorarum halobium]|uniref:hypothetical protein n=1 Tax=Halorarum halobium TaxID=3075121 RepID=UPI0028A6AB41|nr:hypothetical protein [Halobaculum sp. XH14]